MLHAKIVRNSEHLNVNKHEKSDKCIGENAGRWVRGGGSYTRYCGRPGGQSSTISYVQQLSHLTPQTAGTSLHPGTYSRW